MAFSRNALFGALLAAVLAVGTPVFAQNATSKPVVLQIGSQDWDRALKTQLPVTLQVKFNTNLFLQGRDIFSDLMFRLPEKFAKAQLSSISRGLHVALFEAPGFSLEDAKQLTAFFESLSRSELKSAGLYEPVRIFDPADFEVAITGQNIKRVGLRTHEEFRKWHRNFIELVKTRLPLIYAKLESNSVDAAQPPTIVLFDWQDIKGKPLPDAGLADAQTTLRELLRKIIAEYPAPKPLLFDPRKEPVELVAVNVRGNAESSPLFSYKITENDAFAPAAVSRWFSKKMSTSALGVGQSKLVEFHTASFLEGEQRPFAEKTDAQNSWFPASRKFEPLDKKVFQTKLSKNIFRIYFREKSTLKAQHQPSAIGEATSDGLYAISVSHPTLAPKQAASLKGLVASLTIPANANVATGYAVYGSTTREEFKYPADSDLLLNSLVFVPPSVRTLEEAEAFSRKAFLKNVLGYFAGMARKGDIAISEFRLGSDKTMKITAGAASPIDEFWSNPYLTQEDFLSGRYVDKAGKAWSLEEMLELGDFIKTKFDYFVTENGKLARKEVSLQFMPAFDWNGEAHFLRKTGLKGAPTSLLSTAVYFGADSYAIGAVMQRSVAHYVSQRGPLEAGAIRELVQRAYDKVAGSGSYVETEPLWATKFLKTFYNFLVFRNRSGTGIDEIFFEETKKFMERHQTWDSRVTLKGISDALLASINTPEAALLSGLKRLTNDLAEFNERDQLIDPRQWTVRLSELTDETSGAPGLIEQFRSAVKSGRLKPSRAFLKKYANFLKVVGRASRIEDSKLAVEFLVERGIAKDRKILGRVFSDFENAILSLENELHSSAVYATALTPEIQNVIRTMTALSPHLHSRYINSRYQISANELTLNYQLMGIEPTAKNIARMRFIDANLDRLSLRDLAGFQTELFKTPELKSGGCQDLLKHNKNGQHPM